MILLQSTALRKKKVYNKKLGKEVGPDLVLVKVEPVEKYNIAAVREKALILSPLNSFLCFARINDEKFY